MKIKVKKDEIVKIIQDNMIKHKDIFKEAVEAYKKKLLQLLEDKIELVKRGSKINMFIQLPEPENHTKDYKRILEMLKMEVRVDIELEENQFAMYVLDDWEWKREWVKNTLSYTSSAV